MYLFWARTYTTSRPVLSFPGSRLNINIHLVNVVNLAEISAMGQGAWPLARSRRYCSTAGVPAATTEGGGVCRAGQL